MSKEKEKNMLWSGSEVGLAHFGGTTLQALGDWYLVGIRLCGSPAASFTYCTAMYRCAKIW